MKEERKKEGKKKEIKGGGVQKLSN